MKSKKVTMLAAALVVAVVALAGIGYATTYTATTTNSGNEAKATYLTIDQGTSDAAYGGDWLTKVYFDTVNTAHNDNTYTLKKEYGINQGTISKSAETIDMALISVPLSITVTKHNSADVALDVSVTTTGLTSTTAVGGLTYMMALGTASTTGGISMSGATLVTATPGDSGTTWSFEGVSAASNTVTFDLLIFIGGDVSQNATPGEYAGFDETCSFVITVTAEE